MAGSRVLPLHHISIRVPWHDAGWNGTVCQDPVANVECLRLRNIRDNKDDAGQAALAGKSWAELEDTQLPPCVRERAGFLAPFEVTKVVRHPYSEGGGSKAHGHFAPTVLRLPPYSAPAVAFRWMLVKEAEQLADRHGIDLRMDLEEEAERLIGFSTNWLQDKSNQSAMFASFYSALQPQKSLCFFYAKQVPQVDDPRRVLIGVGRVLHVSQLLEYDYTEPGPLQSLVWETPIQHSIKPQFDDGFVFPYQSLLERSRHDESLEPAEFVCFAPEDHWDEFSYASELVTHDGALSALIAGASSLRKLQGVVEGDWTPALAWMDERLGEAWRLRGPCPGLGAALSALALPNGVLMAYELSHRLKENEDPWPLVDRMFADPSSLLPADLAAPIGPVIRKIWSRLPPERRKLLELISRFELTNEQATRLFRPEERAQAGIDATDSDLLRNPYLLYELDRGAVDPISVTTIDRGVFPDPVVRQNHPLPVPSKVEEQVDPRRARALVVSVLERAAAIGDSLWPAPRVSEAVAELEISPPCELTSDVLPVVEENFPGSVALVQMADGSRAYQLGRLAQAGDLIRSTIEKRIKAQRHEIDADWEGLLAGALDPSVAMDEEEARARDEKVSALRELVSSRVSVLIGPAGTGKTTLLSVLAQQPDIRSGGVLLLAPTGKARVQLERASSLGAQTIAQFLLKHDRYNYRTDIYSISGKAKTREAKTVVIDEASMVTEEQLAATIDALEGVERLILVGDPRQLPPIGTGRPFVDIVTRLRERTSIPSFPRVGEGYAELTVRRRQVGMERDDLLLAEWFSGDKPGAGADEVWARLLKEEASEAIRLVEWTDEPDLQEKMLDVLVEELALKDRGDETGFELSVGGTEFKGWVYFRHKWQDHPGAGSLVESWQILSAVRGGLHGVDALNRLIQLQFRSQARERSSPEAGWARRTPRPVGPQGILYGDKVINLNNGLYKCVFGTDKREYVANGEIGSVVGEFKGSKSKMNRLPKSLEVEYSTQLGKKFVYWPWGEEASPPLELAYALTVHKAQGSEFETTFLVIPNPCRPLTRELLYTALTRQRTRVILLHQGPLADLQRYSSPARSDTAHRLTNLFAEPMIREVEGRFLEEGLIHVTRRGVPVRSKSEVIIADLLQSLGVEYMYEWPLELSGVRRRPDFTVEDQNTGRTMYWEHLGLLHDPKYRAKWEVKRSLYRANGIFPLNEGGGPNGLLVESEDDPHGGISSEALEETARKALSWLVGG
jgi:AAA domain/UvrD-like helicase C-terminal domain